MATLVILNPVDPELGARVQVRVCSSNDPDVTGADGAIWWPALVDEPVISSRFFDGDFSSAVSPGSARIGIRIDVLRASGSFPRCERYDWSGASAQVYRYEDQLLVETAFMRVDQFAMEDDALSLNLAVNTEPFEFDVLFERYAGTTGIEGGADLKDRPKPWVFGRAKNIEPVLIDQTNAVFQVSGYGPVSQITSVYERAASFGDSQGDFPDYAALVGADLQEGQWATSVEQGLFRLGAPPAGVITCDVDGDASNGFIRLTGAIIKEVASRLGLSEGINEQALDALDLAVPRNVNVYIAQQTTLIDLARRLAAPCNAVARVGEDGKLTVARVSFGQSSMTLDAQGRQMPPVLGMARQNTQAPFRRIVMGADRSWRVHTLDEIAFFAALIERGRYDNGSTYREGNIVNVEDGSRWLYINENATSGNPPPAFPVTSNSFWQNIGEPGSAVDATSTATVNLFQRASAAPLPPSQTNTFTFATGDLSDIDNGWLTELPEDDGQPAWSTTAYVSSTAETGQVETEDWSAPKKVVQSGEDGIDGQPGTSTAVLTLYRRAPESPTPDKPVSNSIVYTFATGEATNTGFWSTVPPEANGFPLWTCQISVSGSNATATVAGSDFSTPVIASRDGVDATTGLLSNANHTVSASADGQTYSLIGSDGVFDVFRGGEKVTLSIGAVGGFSIVGGTESGSDWVQTKNGLTLTFSANGVYTLSGSNWTSDEETFTLRAETSDNVVIDLIYTISKARAGGNGEDGIDGQPGTSTAEINIYQRASSQPATPSGGSFNFTGPVLTPPSGWSVTIPSGADPVYVSRGVAITNTPGGTDVPDWSMPARAFQDGEAVDAIFRRSSSQPVTPDPSAGTPVGWFTNIQSLPAGDEPIWTSFGSRSSPVADWTWQTPVRLEGIDGLDGFNNAVITLYRRADESPTPAKPVSDSVTYDFSTAQSGNTDFWSSQAPSANGFPLWMTQVAIASRSQTETVDGATFSTPIIVSRDGVSATTGYLTNESHIVAANQDGTNYSLLDAGGLFEVFFGGENVRLQLGAAGGFSIEGGSEVGADWVQTKNGLTLTLNAAGSYTLSGANWSSDSETFTLQAESDGVTLTKVYTITKSVSGADGNPARVISLIASRQQVRFNSAGELDPPTQDTVFSVQRQNTSNVASFEIFDLAGSAASGALLGGTGDTRTLSADDFNIARGSTLGVRVRATVMDGSALEDEITVLRVQDGVDANAVRIGRTHSTFAVLSSTGLPVTQTSTYTASLQAISGTVTWRLKREGSEGLIFPSSQYATVNGNTVTIDETQFSAFIDFYGGTTLRLRAELDGFFDEALITRVIDASGDPGGASFIRTKNGDNGVGGWSAAVSLNNKPTQITRSGARSLLLSTASRERASLRTLIRQGDKFRLRYWINTQGMSASSGALYFAIYDSVGNALTDENSFSDLPIHNSGTGWTLIDQVVEYLGTTEISEWQPGWDSTNAFQSNFLLIDFDVEFLPVNSLVQIDPVANQKLDEIEPEADVTSFIAGKSSLIIRYTFTGVPENGELPTIETFKYMTLFGQIFSGVTWSYRVSSGVVNNNSAGPTYYSLPATGVGQLQINSLQTEFAEVVVRGEFSGKTIEHSVQLAKSYGQPSELGPNGENISSVSSGFSNSLVSLNSVFRGIHPDLIVPAATTQMRGYASLVSTFANTATTGFRTMNLTAQMQRWNGSAWVDFGTQQSATATYERDASGLVIQDSPAIFEIDETIAVSIGVEQKLRMDVRVVSATSGFGSASHSGIVSLEA